jgi:hypothetical protein
MITFTYSIAFHFQVEDSKLIVPLIAEVEVHHSETFYVIKNIRTGRDRQGSILPDLTIKRKNGRWVHIDSEKESLLSIQVGKSIECRENETDRKSSTG